MVGSAHPTHPPIHPLPLMPLTLRLTPMQTPAAPIQAQRQGHLLAEVVGQDEPSCPQLPLYPGEPSELVVQLENQGDRPLDLQLQIEGEFPHRWCYLALETRRLEPGQRTQAVLYFLAPQDFFEPPPLSGSPPPIDYPGRVYVTGRPTEGQPMTELVPFSLHVRPRSLYLDYLPGVFGEIDFMGRLLALFEQAFEPIVQTLDVMWAHLDPLTAPEALLPFLATWVAWPTAVPWGSDRQRHLIRNAVTLYRWRGTRRGLQQFLHLYTDLPLDDHHIEIVEYEGRGFAFGDTALGTTTRLGGGKPYHFIVRLRPTPDHDLDKDLILRIIDQEKPAFCTYDLLIEPPT